MTDLEPLFDQDFIDSLPQLSLYNNAGVVMLCRYLHPFRKKVESWYARLPDSDRKDTRSRLRSDKDSAFSSALFELYLHEYCLSKGWDPERNPLVNDLTPDYLITINGQMSVFLEAANVFQPPDMLGPQKEVNALLDKLNAIEMPFTGNLHLREWPQEQLKPAQIARNIKHKLSLALKANNTKVRIDLSEYGLEGSFDAYFSETSTKLLTLFTSPVGTGLPSQTTMERALEKKCNKYKNLERPFVVAICSSDLFPLNDHTLETILYGDVSHVTNVGIIAPKLKPIRSGGFFPPRSGGTTIHNTRLSAVLYADLERFDDELTYSLRVYHNPWAQHPLSPDVFQDLPQYISGSDDLDSLVWTREPKVAWKPVLR